ncbi:alpha/beta fold hydrolase [Ktedonosporobacter rubrisoli]|uniref:Alpha/beta fold hydrolase n=1 Tax=Ktedonosporobacter rubrisoli TaxID=2509675 RepID=A0A4P6JXH2_KTERU|nr:alpha/beta fold hydrolase [Ktedonosporobacter rubrisoli]QBD80334.1 alpha/beta fold hydrolase [Ktedonosporobacter rubrisoli]
MGSNQVLHINIPTAQGFLEGILKPEEEGTQPLYVSLMCHPHPLGGGTMHNKVVFKAAQALHSLNIPSLRFNFRGVGHSSGTYDDGRGEKDDVRYALEFLSRRYPGVPAIVGGFSFGSYVGLSVAAIDDRVQAMIGLGVAARMFDDNTLQGCHKSKLFIHGTNDELAPYDVALKWIEQVPAPKRIVEIQGADHFFQGRLEEVQAIITNFVRTLGEYKLLDA